MFGVAWPRRITPRAGSSMTLTRAVNDGKHYGFLVDECFSEDTCVDSCSECASQEKLSLGVTCAPFGSLSPSGCVAFTMLSHCFAGSNLAGETV